MKYILLVFLLASCNNNGDLVEHHENGIGCVEQEGLISLSQLSFVRMPDGDLQRWWKSEFLKIGECK